MLVYCAYKIYTVYQVYKGGDFLDIHISYDSSKPMYEQIEEQIIYKICNNQAEDNEPLPSVRQLSTILNVSAITVKRAYADLEREGFIYTIAGKGTFVKLKNIDALKDKYVNDGLKGLEEEIKRLKKAGASKEDIQEIVSRIYDRD